MAPSPTPDAYRPYRRAVFGSFLAIACLGSLVFIVSVMTSVAHMTPARRAPSGQPLGPEECAAEIRSLFGGLEEGRKNLTRELDVHRADRRWDDFRVGWLQRFRDVEARCNTPHGPRFQKALSRLEALLNLYTTHAVQFAGEVGPTVDSFRKAIDAADEAAPKPVTP